MCTEDVDPVRIGERAAVRRPVGLLPILLAAVIGSIGAVGFSLGLSPVVMAAEHRRPALVIVVLIPLVTAAAVARSSLRSVLVLIPLLGAAAALATWSTAGRIHGVWCVLATSAAALALRGLCTAGRSTTRSITGVVVLGAVAAAGLAWALDGAGPVPLVVLVVPAAIGLAVIGDDRLVAVGDRRIASASVSVRSSSRRALARLRAAPGRVVDRWSSCSIRVTMAVSGVLAAVLTAPIFHRLAADESTFVNGFNDFRSHLDLAAQMKWSPLRVTAPHPVFHVSVRLLGNLLGETAAVTVVLSVAVGLSIASLTWIATQPFAGRPGLSARVAPLFSLGFLFIESPAVTLQALHLLPDDSRYAAVHIWANPTEVMVLPFVFLFVVKVAELLGSERPERRLVLTTATLTVATTMTKPALTLALVPALVLLLLLRRSAGRAATGALVGAVVVPAAAIVVWQTWFLEAGNLPYGRSEFELRPFATVRSLQLGGDGPWFWLALVIVPLAVWIGRRAFLRDRTVVVTLASLGCALAILLLFEEGGIRQFDGNLAKPAYYAWVLLFAWSFRYVVVALADERATRAAGGRRPGWVTVSVVVLALLVTGGVTAWLDAVGAISVPVPRAAT